jgi:hypothetical protein
MVEVFGVRRVACVAATAATLALGALGILAACGSSDSGGSSGTTAGMDTGTSDGPVAEAGPGTDADMPMLGKCAASFGNALSEGFGRIDGVVFAVQKPTDQTCAMPDPDHVVVQVLMNGAVYRMVIDVGSSRPTGTTDTQVRYAKFPHAMPEPAYAEGWNTGIPLDYANLLGAHSTDGGFSQLTFDEGVAKIVAELKVGDPVSVYAISATGHPESAEMVHRNMPGTNTDGAIVLAPTSNAPTFLLFHFAEQTF